MLYAIAAFLVLILDQAVKYWVTVGIELDKGVKTFIPGIISLVNMHNYGAAFGILQNARWLFIIIAVFFVALVVYALAKNIIKEPLGQWSAVLVMAGAVGNCIDRVMNGYVVDMFRFEFLNFAIFNVADIFITVCGILFCIHIIFSQDFKGKDKKAAKENAPEKKPRPGTRKLPETKLKDLPEKTPPSSAAYQKPVAAAKPDDEGVRTYKPRQRTAQPAPADGKASPFAEWEPETLSISSVNAEPAAAKAPPSKPAKEKSEFSLDDILAEFSSK